MKKVLAGIAIGLLIAASAVAKPTTPKKVAKKPSVTAPGSAKNSAAAPVKSGPSRNLGAKEWPAIHGITTLGSKMYVASGVTLLVADSAGSSTDLYPKNSPDWGNPTMLTAFEGRLYVLCDGGLYDVDPKDGKNSSLGDGYHYPGGIAGLAGKLYVASDDALWAVDKKTGKYLKFTKNDWYNVHGVTALDDKLYVVSNQSLFAVDASGAVAQLPGTFPNVRAMASADGKLFVFTFDPTAVLYQVDKGGKSTVLPLPVGWDPTTGASGMTVLNDKLYLLEPNAGSTTQLFTIDTQ